MKRYILKYSIWLRAALLIIPIFIPAHSFSGVKETPAHLLYAADSIFNLDTDEQVTLVEVIRKKPRTYFAVSAKTLNHSYADVKSLTIDYTQYVSTFKYMLKSIPVTSVDSIQEEMTLFFVAGAGIARSWFLGDADSAFVDSSKVLKIILRQNHDIKLNKAWEDSCGGWIKIGYKNYTLQWWVKDLGNSKTRLGLIAYVIPRQWVPKWLFRVVSRVVYPRCVEDVELKLNIKKK